MGYERLSTEERDRRDLARWVGVEQIMLQQADRPGGLDCPGMVEVHNAKQRLFVSLDGLDEEGPSPGAPVRRRRRPRVKGLSSGDMSPASASTRSARSPGSA